MLFLSALAFVLLYTVNQIAGFGAGIAMVGVAVMKSVLRGTGLRLNRKDLLYAVYAAAAILPALRYWDAYDFTFYMRVVLYPWAVSIAFQNLSVTWTRIRIWSWAVLGVSFVTAGLMLFQDAPGSFDLSFNRLISLDRTRGFYYKGDERIGPNAAAAMSVAGMAVTMALQKFRRISVAGSVAVLSVLALFLGVAGGRIALAGLVGLIFLYVASGFFSGSGSRVRHLLVTALVVVFLGVGGSMLYGTLLSTQGDAFQERVEGVSNPLQDNSLLVRFNDWQRAVQMIESEPWGLGFNAYYGQYGRTPHNEVLGQWIGGGWVGALLYLLVMGYLTTRSTLAVFRRRGHDEAAFGHYLALSLLGVTWLAMVTEHISRGGMNGFYPILWMAIGLSYAHPGGSRPSEPLDAVVSLQPTRSSRM